jgi:Phosphoesterase family
MQKFASALSVGSAALALAACSSGPLSQQLAPGRVQAFNRAAVSSPIEHIVLVIQENRTFNNLFATFPGAVGTTVGMERVKNKTKSIYLTEVNLSGQHNLNHSYNGYLTAYDGGKMDGFNEVRFSKTNKPEGATPYEYVDPSQIAPYWAMAQQYGLADAMFTTQGSASFTAHQDLIRGGTDIDSSDSMIDNPPYGTAWGCDSPAGTTTSLITTGLQYERNAGPFPCTNDFPGSGAGYLTLRGFVEILHPEDRQVGRDLERVRRDLPGAVRSRVGHERHLARDEHLQRHLRRHAGRDVVGRTGQYELGPSQQTLRHGPLLGGQHRQRNRREPILGLVGHHRRVGRLGRLLRSGEAAAAR